MHDIVRVVFFANAFCVPSPELPARIEDKQPLLGEGSQEPNSEERISARLFHQELRQWLCPLSLTVKGLGNQRLGVFLVKRRQDYLLNPYIARSDCVECPCERVSLTDFVSPIRSDYEQVANSRMDKQVLKEVQSRRIDPLQIVEEQCKRVLFTCKHVQ